MSGIVDILEIEITDEFEDWINALQDRRVRTRIQARIDRLELGNPGKHRVLDGSLTEMKLDFGPGYRVYYTQQGRRVVIILCGGDKSTQDADISRARALITRIRRSHHETEQT